MTMLKTVCKMHWEDLPKEIRRGMECVSWKNCNNKMCKFEYNGVKGEIKIISYDNKSEKLGIKYLDENIFYINTAHFKKCKIGVLIGEISRKFIYDIDTIINGLKITEHRYGKDNRGNQIRVYKYRCIKCGFDCGQHYKNGEFVKEHLIPERDLKKGNGCYFCNGNQIVIPGINDIPTTAPWMVKYFQGGYDEAKLYSKGSHQKVYMMCPDCGDIGNNKTTISNVHKRKALGCVCGDGFSYPEKFIHSTLNQLNLNFTTQLSKSIFTWCDKYRYDFYIPITNLIIEVHGEQHYRDTGRGRTLKEEEENDSNKEGLALNNGIKEYIVLDCRESNLEFIKSNILNSRLVELHDLSIIDWSKVEEFAMSNLSKKARDLYNNSNDELSPADIGMLIGVSRGTVLRWLKQWAKLGLCSYSLDKSNKNRIHKVRVKTIERCSKPVEIFKDNVSLGIFKSCSDLSRKSLDKFSIKLNQSSISTASINNKKYKGFTFKYV